MLFLHSLRVSTPQHRVISRPPHMFVAPHALVYALRELEPCTTQLVVSSALLGSVTVQCSLVRSSCCPRFLPQLPPLQIALLVRIPPLE